MVDTTAQANSLPRHVAVIMDGNGRWARERGEDRIFGHAHGVESVRSVVRAAGELGVEYLTLYAFSTENWSRPQAEINALMELLVESLAGEVDELARKGVRLRSTGALDSLPDACRAALRDVEERTAHCTGLTLILALSYSGRWELTEAVRSIVRAGTPEVDITEETVRAHMGLPDVPDPELLIRTSGEQRLSNFLLWQLAYAELHFTTVMWPDFREDHFRAAVHEFRGRERRFGRTGDQLRQAQAGAESPAP
ncbi:MAG: di-trans,poly-cis-decaprenylcistransferase [Crocinitomicaceae bacterium TMED114]|nr:MAG: di-trans,poly-cis-decaprenylcistransferase [Crocinitomicaceae bacterium TMED114]